MRVNSGLGTQAVTYDDADAGEGLAIFFSQGANDTGRWRLQILARIDEGLIQVGEIYVSPPNSAKPSGNLSRVVGTAVCPGARSWTVNVQRVGEKPNPEETADIILASSRCYAPFGASRSNERYKYHAGSGNFNFTVLPGMTVTGIGAIGIGGGGTVVIDGGDTITVPANISANPEPKAPIIPGAIIAFTSVDWVVEYLESA